MGIRAVPVDVVARVHDHAARDQLGLHEVAHQLHPLLVAQLDRDRDQHLARQDGVAATLSALDAAP